MGAKLCCGQVHRAQLGLLTSARGMPAGDSLSQRTLAAHCDGRASARYTRAIHALDFVHTVHETGFMRTAYVSGRVPARCGQLVARQARAARTTKSNLVARYVIEKSLETEFPGISFRDSVSGREAYLTGHRVAVWEVLAVHDETRSAAKTAEHFRWPRVLVTRALAYAKAFPEEVRESREGETASSPVVD